MARPTKSTIDYFPHYIKGGKTLFILENDFGNDGYAFWFKLLEILGSTEGMVFDYGNPANMRFLLSKTRVPEDLCIRIIDTLATVDAIDRELWVTHQLIWVQNLVDNVQDAFKKRVSAMPQKPCFSISSNANPISDVVSDAETPLQQEFLTEENGKLKESKLKESKEKKQYAEFVSMTEAEHQKLIQEYGEQRTERMINKINSYKGSSGKKYKSDYLAILNWVVGEVEKQTPKQQVSKQMASFDQEVAFQNFVRDGGNPADFRYPE